VNLRGRKLNLIKVSTLKINLVNLMLNDKILKVFPLRSEKIPGYLLLLSLLYFTREPRDSKMVTRGRKQKACFLK
jgi:hypothetical protein